MYIALKVIQIEVYDSMSKVSGNVKNSNNGFFMLDNSFVDNGVLASLSNTGLRVYLVILRFSNSAKNVAFPSYTAIQKHSGLKSRTSISRGINELQSLGIITKITKGSNLKHQSNTYKVNVTPKIAAKAPQTQIVGPLSQKATPTNILSDSSSPISPTGILRVTGIEDLDIKLTEAYLNNDYAKAQQIIRESPEDIIPLDLRVSAYATIKKEFNK